MSVIYTYCSVVFPLIFFFLFFLLFFLLFLIIITIAPAKDPNPAHAIDLPGSVHAFYSLDNVAEVAVVNVALAPIVCQRKVRSKPKEERASGYSWAAKETAKQHQRIKVNVHVSDWILA